jgi:hypothetical protein
MSLLPVWRARLEPDEAAQLRSLVSARTGVGLRQIDARIKAARAAHDKEEAQRAAAETPIDGRVAFAAPALNAELTPVMQQVDAVLSTVKGVDQPMRSASGVLCQIRNRPSAGLHQLMSRDQKNTEDPADRLPAPAEPLIWELDVDNTVLAIERHIRFTHTDKRGVTSDVQLPAPFARTYRTYSESALPRVFGVATAPLVTETGVLVTNGLNSELGLDFRIDPMLCRLVPDHVSDEDAREAYRFLADEWLCDVSTNEEGKALIIASMLTIVERPLLPERPAFFITAGQRGGGKTTLANMISGGALGRRASAASWSPNEEERRKAVFAHFREGPAMIVWDNLPRGAAVSSPVIEKSLTSPMMSDRILGQSEQISVPATTVQFFTGNNILPSSDMASRSFIIRLDVSQPDPENRDFKHPDPFAWTLEHRAKIMRSFYTLLVWNPYLRIEPAKRPPAKTRFKRWWTLCGVNWGRLSEQLFRVDKWSVCRG